MVRSTKTNYQFFSVFFFNNYRISTIASQLKIRMANLAKLTNLAFL